LLVYAITLLSFGKTIDLTNEIYENAIHEHCSSSSSATIYVLKCPDIELPTKIGNQNIVNIENLTKFMKGRKSTNVLKVMPLRVDEANIIVGMIDYLVVKKANGEIFMNNSGGEEIFYKYDEKCHCYKLISRKKNSI